MKVKEEIKKVLNGINKTAILVALILGLSVVGYGYLNISYKNKVFETEQAEKVRERLAEEAEKIELEEEEQLEKTARERCFQTVSKQHQETWNLNCKNRGLEESCSLPLDLSERLKNNMDKDMERCLNLLRGK